ncbi:MAG: PrsW family glutamic-type intramembrane protease [Caldilineaceae bacterium]
MILDSLGTLGVDGASSSCGRWRFPPCCTVVLVLILRFLDRRRPKRRSCLPIALLWGGLIATGLALPFNNAILQAVANAVAVEPAISEFLGPDAPLLIGAPLAGPLEEITKGLGVLVLFWLFRAEFDNLRATASSTGPGAGGGRLQLAGSAPLRGPGLRRVQGGALRFPTGRTVLAFFGLAGPRSTPACSAFLGLSRQTATRWLHWAAPFVGLLLAISAHFLNNVLGLVVTIVGPAERRTLARTGTATRRRPGRCPLPPARCARSSSSSRTCCSWASSSTSAATGSDG